MLLTSRHGCAVLLLLAAAQASGQSLSVSPSVVSLVSAGELQGTPPRATVLVASSGQPVSFTASVRYLDSSSGWLSVAPAGGTTPATLTLTATAGSLASGTYLAQVVVTAGPAAAVVNVRLSVGVGGRSTSLLTNKTGLTFNGYELDESGQISEQTVTVTSATGAPVSFRVTTTGGWLTAPPFPMTTPATFSVFASQLSLSPGVHTGSITITPVGGGSPAVLPVALVATSPVISAPELELSQTDVAFSHQLNTPEPPTQSVTVEDSLGGFREFTATADQDWIKLVTAYSASPPFPVFGFTSGELEIQVEPGDRSVGTYFGSVTVASTGLDPKTIRVSMTVTSTPALNASPSSVTLDDVSLTSRPVVVTATGSANIAFAASVTSATPWLAVSPASGSTGTSGGQTLTISGNPSVLAPGTYVGNVRLTSANFVTNIPVRFEVTGATGAESGITTQTTSLGLSGVVGLPVAPQYIDVVPNPPGSSHNFTAAAESEGGWLSVEPFSASALARLTVRVNAANLTPGSYTGQIVLTSLVNGTQTMIPVSLRLDAAGIVADPMTLTFKEESRGAAPPAQTVRISANTPATYTVSATAPWILVTPRSGFTPAALTINVDLKQLKPGQNDGSIQITSANGQINIPVIATAMLPPAPVASPQTLTLTHEIGSPAPLVGSISVSSTAEPISITARAATDSGYNWLSVSPGSGSTPSTLAVTVDKSLLTPGKQTGSITITGPDPAVAPAIVPVAVDVRASGVVTQTLLHAASLVPTPVAPGLIVTITGTGLGPAAGVAARPSAAGAIETRLGDTRVLFDSVPAPLLFVRDDQINAIVPYSVFGKFSARMQIERGASFSVPVEYRVVDAVPGLFTVDGSGRGQAAALNSDLTVNSMSNPALRGSIISVYGTGEGQTDPQGQDGRIISTDLRRPMLRAEASIGGVPAQVLYFGSAPGLVSGAFQANLRVPEGIEPGTQPIEIRIGDVVSRPGLMISVR